jgi:hypothetical protein
VRERRGEKKKKKNREEGSPGTTPPSSSCRRNMLVLYMMTEMSPCHDADGDGDGSTSWPCLQLAPRAGVVYRLWRPVPSCLALWVTWAPSMACHGFGSCQGVSIPIRCQKFDSGLELLCLWWLEAVRAPCWASTPVQG